ncbi:MAG: sigma-54 dependent transcriptional regulator, partial [Verrucomicrobiota bacterium]
MRQTILLIDDDPLDVSTLEMMFSGWDYDVLTARSGEEGLKVLEEATVDLLISDVWMPGIKGNEVLTQTLERYPELPVILITGRADIETAVDSMKQGAFDYVQKPPDEDDLKLTVERAMEHARLRRENEFLRAELAAGGKYGERLIGQSPAMQKVFDLIHKVARTDSTVLITGETGTGKELVAQTIHFNSPRAKKPMIAFNCAAFNPNLMESELFGHEKGAFTGAVSTRRGRFEDADGGMLFLDEIGETSLEFQAKLLRVLQEKELERVGGNTRIEIDVRVLASTNRDLQDEVKEGRFREDLYYRLRVIPIHMPPLRERGDDIILLATTFMNKFSEQYNCEAESFSKKCQEYLLSREWKGNVRELEHALERAVILS